MYGRLISLIARENKKDFLSRETIKCERSKANIH